MARCVRCRRPFAADPYDQVVCESCLDSDDFDADELGLDPEDDYDA